MFAVKKEVRARAGNQPHLGYLSSTFLRAAVKHKAMPPGPQSLASMNSYSQNQRSEWKTLGVGLISLSREQLKVCTVHFLLLSYISSVPETVLHKESVD